MNNTNKPVKEIRVGAVRAAIWSNQRHTGNGQTFNSQKVQLERIYKDASGNFASTGSLDVTDIPKAILALKKAYEFCVLDGTEPSPSPAPQSQPVKPIAGIL